MIENHSTLYIFDQKLGVSPLPPLKFTGQRIVPDRPFGRSSAPPILSMPRSCSMLQGHCTIDTPRAAD
jgi:hypothetical protein